MNELQVLDREIALIEQRAEELSTDEGKKKLKGLVLQTFAALEGAGYIAPKGDTKVMAGVWSKMLAEWVSIYGWQIVEEATWSFIGCDKRTEKFFPKPSDLIDHMKKIGGTDPRVKMARKKAEELEEKLIAEWKKELRNGNQSRASKV